MQIRIEWRKGMLRGVLLGVLLGVSIATVLIKGDRIIHGYKQPPTADVPAQPIRWSDDSVASDDWVNEWMFRGQHIRLRFAPNLPMTRAYNIMRVVDGAANHTIRYIPWVHDHPNVPPLPHTYVTSLTEVLIAESTTAKVIGLEGCSDGISSRIEAELIREIFDDQCEMQEPFDHANDTATTRALHSILMTNIIKILEQVLSRFPSEWITYDVALRTQADIVYVENDAAQLFDLANFYEEASCEKLSTKVAWSLTKSACQISEQVFGDAYAWIAPQSSLLLQKTIYRLAAVDEYSLTVSGRSVQCGAALTNEHVSKVEKSRERSHNAVRNTIAALDARGGGNAVLIFGAAHYRDIEEAARAAGATLDLVCMPHLCVMDAEEPSKTRAKE